MTDEQVLAVHCRYCGARPGQHCIVWHLRGGWDWTTDWHLARIRTASP